MIKILKGTEHTEEFQPKPDQSRLLTAEETGVIYQRVNAKYDDAGEILHEYHKALLKAQRDLTASIKDAECQARIEALIEEIKNFDIQLKAQGFVAEEYHEFITNRVKGIVAKYTNKDKESRSK